MAAGGVVAEGAIAAFLTGSEGVELARYGIAPGELASVELHDVVFCCFRGFFVIGFAHSRFLFVFFSDELGQTGLIFKIIVLQ